MMLHDIYTLLIHLFVFISQRYNFMGAVIYSFPVRLVPNIYFLYK